MRDLENNVVPVLSLKPQTLAATGTGEIVDLLDIGARGLLVGISGAAMSSTNKWTLTLEAGNSPTLADAAAVDDAELAGGITSLVNDAASSLLTITSNATATKKVTIGEQDYVFVEALTTSPAAVPYEVLVGASAAATAANLVAAINGAAGEGTTYGTGTDANTQVTAVQGTGGNTNKVTITAIVAGADGNSIATTTDDIACAWTGETMTGGIDAGTVSANSSGAFVFDAPVPACGAVGIINYLGTKRYARVKMTKAASAPNVVFIGVVLKAGAKYLPV